MQVGFMYDEAGWNWRESRKWVVGLKSGGMNPFEDENRGCSLQLI